MGFQASGAAPIVEGRRIDDPQTVASAIRIGNPASWQNALEARDGSDGVIDSVTDEEILEAYGRLAREEGIFCEPASAACVAGLIKTSRQRSLGTSICVCAITGSGLKDQDSALGLTSHRLELPANLEEIEAALPI